MGETQPGSSDFPTMNAVHGTAPPPYSVVESENVRKLSANSSSTDSVSSGSGSSAALSMDMVSLHSSLRDEEYGIEPKTSWIPQEPRNPRRSQCLLEKPVVIPRVDFAGPLKVPLPFTRSYSPVLQAHGIYKEDFVAFLDNLTVAQGPPAPLAMLNTAGSIAGLVPYHWAQLAGGIANVTAGLGTAATRIVRTKLFLDKVNRDYFEPRGLKASICRSKTLAARLGCGEQLPELLPTTPETCEMSLQDRRMRTLAPYVAPLSFEVPPPSKERNIVDRMTEKQIERAVKKKEKQRERKRSKIRNSNQDQLHDESKYVQCSDGSLTDKKVLKFEKRYERNQRKMEKAERKAAEKLDKKEPLESKKIKRKEEKKIRKAEKKCQRLDEQGEEANSRRADKMIKSQAKDRKKSEKMEFLLIEPWRD
ncbi:hypothetical protein HER10_EVM0012678 [Colletotrichum scovillei]|uniref:Uncharacterized protein n=1 Tax=Colletotrichum scovillei TaxID=1209932 RepID=A0A9P7QX14_9PEZI|nr:uncharacterized protein HER10_EVM0012678 [Colletotrichum scovillei]KAF4775626.1 hypothetical protein HER10_EVM0012678 [Colletotrichum scovillei]KAG7039760.1 hypothetical protein JMJ78_0001506 [Colletotrichum scovillei]KAG7041916.1 hypothetical protein JMJ77_0012432 [Colletotrichum scovillei]KAG7061948.1 hypothetical protein JMJ76_0003902 [Colletotrichum scovillei]